MKTLTYLTKAQAVRKLGLESYHHLAPLLRRSGVKTKKLLGTEMIDVDDLPALRKARAELLKERK